MTESLQKWDIWTQTHIQENTQWRWRQRSGRWIYQPSDDKDCQQQPEARTQASTLLIPWSRSPNFQDCETVNFCHLWHSFVVLCHGSPRKWTQPPHRVRMIPSLFKTQGNSAWVPCTPSKWPLLHCVVGTFWTLSEHEDSLAKTECPGPGQVAQLLRASPWCARLQVLSLVRAHTRSNQWTHT